MRHIIKHCIRCQQEWFSGKKLSQRQVEAIKEITFIYDLDVQYDNIVCNECRHYIGDETADSIYKIFSDESKVQT